MGGPHGGPGGPGTGEKAKDLIGTWKKLLGYCRKYMAVFVIAMICAAVGTVLMLIGPDKLSEMTDTITEGIAPDTETLSRITEAISDNVSGNMELLTEKIGAGVGGTAEMGQKAALIMTSPDIADEDKQKFQEIFMGMGEGEEEMFQKLLTLPESVLNVLFTSVELNGIVIEPTDQVRAIKLFGSLAKQDKDQISRGDLSQLPETVLSALCTDVFIDGVNITGQDQMEMMDIFAHFYGEKTEAALKAMDQLPGSVYSLIKSSVDMDRIFAIGTTLIACVELYSLRRTGVDYGHSYTACIPGNAFGYFQEDKQTAHVVL